MTLPVNSFSLNITKLLFWYPKNKWVVKNDSADHYTIYAYESTDGFTFTFNKNRFKPYTNYKVTRKYASKI